MVEKNTEQVAPGITAEFDPFTFVKKFKKWETTMSSLSGQDTIGANGNLLEHITQHVNTTVRRPNSKNDGTDGAFVTLEKISQLLKKEKPPTLKELEMLKDFFEEIEDLLGHETLDPRNTLFHEPSKYTVVDGKVVVEPDTPDREVYGHYRTKYMEDKSKGKLKELKGFYSFSPDQAEPPYYLALFGEGQSLGGKPIVGLYYQLEQAIEELEKQKYKLEVGQAHIKGVREAKKLAAVGSIRRIVGGLLKRKNLYDDGNKFNTKRAAEYLSTKEIALKGKDNEKLGKIVGIPGNFRVSLNITGKQLKALIGQLDVYSRTSRFSEAKSPVNQEPVVLKSWMDLLRA